MYVNVEFATIGGSKHTTPVVPVAAVQNMNNQQVVFVGTREPDVFIMRPVRLGPESNGHYPVLEGLSVGDQIVTEGRFVLRAEWLKPPSGTMNTGGMFSTSVTCGNTPARTRKNSENCERCSPRRGAQDVKFCEVSRSALIRSLMWCSIAVI